MCKMILLNEQINNKLYTSKEYVNAKQIMLSRCVAIKIAFVISPGTGSVVDNVHFISDLHPQVVIRVFVLAKPLRPHEFR